MKKIFCLICILICFGTTGCSSATFNVEYDDIMLYVTPVDKAAPGDIVQVKVNAKECASFLFYVDEALLSAHAHDEYFITYEFIMPYHDVKITHIEQEEPEMNQLTIPATMRAYRIDYSTPYSFDGKYMIVTNREESEKLFAGFALQYAETIEPYGENFFENNILVAYVQHEGSGSVSHSLKNVVMEEDTLFITINRHVPYIGTCDMASHLCLIAISKNSLPSTFETVIRTEEVMA